MEKEKQGYLIIICGPTASGKTGLSIKLAEQLNAEIISCDSRQFFKEMEIGTAKPNAIELAAATHHFVNNLSITEQYSVGDFEREVIAFLENYFEQKKVAIMVGGSGLYIRAICQGLDYYPEVDKSVREGLSKLYEVEGLEPLQEELKKSDPDYYEKVDLQNVHRLIRALEICRATGKPFSSFQRKSQVQRNFKIIKIGIDWDRQKLYERINLRVDLMLEAGLEAEARRLFPKSSLNALQTVGYQEFFDYFRGKTSKQEAIELIKRNTRRYAKRQLTWLRKEPDLEWFAAGTNPLEIIDWLRQKMQ